MRQARDERGTVTAETAIVLPVAVMMLLAGMWVVGVVVAHIRCQDAARDTARALARGDAPGTAESIGARAAPPGAQIQIDRQGAEVRVVVVADVRSDRPLLRWAPTVRATGSAVVQLEPGLAEPDLVEPGLVGRGLGGPGLVEPGLAQPRTVGRRQMVLRLAGRRQVVPRLAGRRLVGPGGGADAAGGRR
jgi:hypothetical protein